MKIVPEENTLTNNVELKHDKSIMCITVVITNKKEQKIN